MPPKVSPRWKWLLGLLIALGVVVAARAALQSDVFFPQVFRSLPTPVVPTPTPVPGIFIIEINFDPQGNPIDEYVTIRNQNRDVEDRAQWVFMEGWILRDEEGHEFEFPRFTLLPLTSVRVWTKAGQTDATDPANVQMYWNLTEPVWNDHGDCAYLRTHDNEPVHSRCFP
jgi:hypothetical protein